MITKLTIWRRNPGWITLEPAIFPTRRLGVPLVPFSLDVRIGVEVPLMTEHALYMQMRQVDG